MGVVATDTRVLLTSQGTTWELTRTGVARPVRVSHVAWLMGVNREPLPEPERVMWRDTRSDVVELVTNNHCVAVSLVQFKATLYALTRVSFM